jgi:hypothetical protein
MMYKKECHSREGGNLCAFPFYFWIPAFAGMTTLIMIYVENLSGSAVFMGR